MPLTGGEWSCLSLILINYFSMIFIRLHTLHSDEPQVGFIYFLFLLLKRITLHTTEYPQNIYIKAKRNGWE